MQLTEIVQLPRAKAHIQHLRPRLDAAGVPIPFRFDETTGLPIIDENVELLGEETVHNVITNAGRDFLHTQGYGTAAQANGLNYIALSNDALTETTASTVLSTEIAANGLARAIGTVAHTTGTNTTTVSKTFTCATAAQAAQKAALFTAAAAGTMNHALAFTQRSLQIGDTLACTFTITVG